MRSQSTALSILNFSTSDEERILNGLTKDTEVIVQVIISPNSRVHN